MSPLSELPVKVLNPETKNLNLNKKKVWTR
jgi:hypothetical protein